MVAFRTKIKRYKISIVLLCCFFVFAGFLHYAKAGELPVDSLLKMAEQATGHSKAELLLEAAQMYLDMAQAQESQSAAQQALVLSEELKDKPLLAESYYMIGLALQKQKKTAPALSSFNNSLELLRETENTRREYDLLTHVSLLYVENNHFTTSLEYAQEAMKLAQQFTDKQPLAESYILLGTIYNSLNSYHIALDYYFRAQELLQWLIFFDSEDAEKKHELANIYKSIGTIFYNQQNYESANTYFFRCLRISKEAGYDEGVAAAYNNIGEIHRAKGRFQQAIEYYSQSLEINEENNNTLWVAINSNNMGEAYQAQKKYDEAVIYFFKSVRLSKLIGDEERIASAYNSVGAFCNAINDYEKATEYFSEALKNARSSMSLFEIKDAAYGMSVAYENLGDFQQAYRYHKLYKQMTDSIYNIQKIKDITRLQMQNEFERQEKIQDIEQQNKDLEIRNKQLIIRFFIAIFILAVLAILALIYRYQYVKRTSKQLRKQQKIIHEKEKELIRKNNEHLREKIEHQNKELTSKAMHIVRNKELNIKLLSDLRKINAEVGIKGKRNKIISETVQSMISELKSSSGDNAWAEFELRFEQVHQSFYDNLMNKFPNLTPNEKKLSAFIRLDMSSKEISAITFQSVQSIEVARSRLRRKFNLSNTDVSLSQFLAQF